MYPVQPIKDFFRETDFEKNCNGCKKFHRQTSWVYMSNHKTWYCAGWYKRSMKIRFIPDKEKK